MDAGLRLVCSKQRFEELGVELQRGALGIDEMLQGKADVERDHGACEIAGRHRGRAAGVLESLFDCGGRELPGSAPEAGRQRAELVVAPGVRQELEPKTKEPVP